MEKFDLFNLKFNGYSLKELGQMARAYRTLCEFEWIAEKHPELSQHQAFDIALEVADRFEDLEFGQEENDIIWDVFRERGLKW